MAEAHSLGPTCAYYEDDPDTCAFDDSSPPKVKAQFFYISSLPIDDPLSPLPPIQAEQVAKQPPQPFSARDNAALEEAWQGCQKDQGQAKGSRPTSKSKPIKGVFSFPKFKNGAQSKTLNASDSDQDEQTAAMQSGLRREHDRLSKRRNPASKEMVGHSDKRRTPNAPVQSGTKLAKPFEKVSPKAAGRKDQEAEQQNESDEPFLTESQVMLSQTSKDSKNGGQPIDSDELRCQDPEHTQTLAEPVKRHRRLSPFRRKVKGEKSPREPLSASTPVAGDGASESQPDQTPPQSGSDMSGRPFARAPSRRNVATISTDGARDHEISSEDSDNDQSRSRSRLRSPTRKENKKKKHEVPKVFVPVGVSRLHLVEMPDLIMKPIYWSPINDMSSVLRATWFYKETMLPVPVDVANRLEIGYEYMKPYAESYQEELQACIDNGASAELKIVYKLWPDDQTPSRPATALDGKAEDRFQNEVLQLLPDVQENVAADPREKKDKQLFETYSAIYTDGRNAQLLRPSLLPSVRQNRRPLSSIRKGRQIGIAVVRGFDRKTWLKLHPDPKMDAKAAHAKVGAYMSQSGDATTRGRRMSCGPCESESRAPRVSDLVLVIHGIGQKLSERVDSFHFTHAINGLRREFNVELSSGSVKGSLKDTTGIMVLPVNWRLTVSFDDEDKPTEGKGENGKYQLTDITPDTLPGVRSLISDVMLDIPYYLSHHKDKMTSAVIREANRVYRLWCRNNPGFQEYGRVHLIAHSLGSVMAVEILSQQPTKIPEDLKLDSAEPSEKMFEFDTANLFCCGSPCGFFLLLNNANLIPRKGRNKPGMEGEDHGQGIAGEAGYGCPSLDNIYNICHRNDPVSYLLNASVDKEYAISLQPATIPTVNAGFFTRVGNTLRWASNSADAYASAVPQARPQMQSMPSTVEMDTHNFTREEIAEKRMYLLNDNGQIDYYLNSGGGPLEIQYLNMLSAHSSYWILQDFVRFLVVEIGRQPGKQHTLPALRAAKKREFKHGSIA